MSGELDFILMLSADVLNVVALIIIWRSIVIMSEIIDELERKLETKGEQ